MTRLRDADARARAADDLDTCLLVEAPAGSGKTTLLVDRVLAWVRSGRARLPEIVAITFTERAAAELRLRVRERIERLQPVVPATERPALDRALTDLELAPIRTIHGFCGDLLRDRPVEAGIDPGFTIADPLAAELLFDETWERWLERMAAEAPPALGEAVALGVSVEALRGVARALVAERDLLDGRPLPAPEPFATLNRDVRQGLAALVAAAPSGERAARDRLAQDLADLAAWMRRTEPLPEPDQLTAILTELPFRSPAGRGSGAVWGQSRIGAARAALQALVDRVAEARAVRLHNLAATLAGWLTGFVASYVERLRRLGLADFHDLLLATRDLLRDRPDVRRDFQARIRTLLVDEFQDTDPLQLEIAFLLAEDPTGPAAGRWDQVRLGPGRLFLVGDPKQSIYRFRRADIETYERARELLRAQGDVLLLETNFRSVGRLLAAVNRTFADQMQPPADGRYQPVYAAVVPAPGAPDGEPPALLEAPPDAPTGERAEPRRAREAAALASLLARIVTAGTWRVRDRETGAARPVRYGDVVCLFRTLTGVTVYEDALRGAGVPYRTIGGRHYYGRSEVGWTIAALTAIEDPHDPVALVAALRSPFFGVPDDALLAHAASGGAFCYLDPLPPDPHPAIGEAWTLLRDLHGRRVRETSVATVEALYAESEVLATYALDPHGDQRVANLLRVLDTARALEAAGRPTFRGLVRWLLAQGAGEYEESESIVVEEGDQVVRLMTVHAAKGLEFPVVALPDLGWSRRATTPPLVVDRRPEGAALAVSLGKAGDWRVETRNLAGLLEREERRADAEELRLFYVAMTRARDHLLLPFFVGADLGGFARFCAPLLDEAAGLRRLVAEPESPRAAPPPGPAPALTPRAAWAAARDSALARGRATPPPLHPGAGPARGPGARLGALVHLALALADLSDSAAAGRATADAAARLGATGELVAAAGPLVAHALAAPPYRRAARAPHAARELPVAALVDGQLVDGVADLVFDEGEGLVVVEVKLAPAEPEAETQLVAYCRALAAAGLRVREAWLLTLAGDGAAVRPVSSPTAPIDFGGPGAVSYRVPTARRQPGPHNEPGGGS